MNRIRATFKDLMKHSWAKPSVCCNTGQFIPGSVLRHRDASHSDTTVATVVASSNTGPLRRNWATSISQLITRGAWDSQDRSCPPS